MAEDLEQLVLTISADTRQMQRALARLVGDTQQAAGDVDRAFGTAPPKIDNVAKSLNKTRFETANLAAQFQDIAVQLQGGQSPFTVALQQGTQIAQVLGRQGAGGTVALLSTAFQSLLSPVSLATIGIIALGGGIIQYGAKAIGAVDDLDDKLKAHDALIRSLKDAYGEAGKGIDGSFHEVVAVLRTLLGFSTEDLKKQMQGLSNSVAANLTTFVQLGDAVGQFTEETPKKFSAFGGAIDAFKTSVKSGTPDVLAFRRAIQEIADNTADEKTKKLAKELFDLTEPLTTIQTKVEGTTKALRNLDPAMQAIIDQGEKFAKAMESLSKTVTPDLSDREKIMKNYNDALEKAGSTEERLAASRAKNDQLAVLSANERKKASEEEARDAESAQKRFDTMLNSAAKHSAQITGQAAAMGQGANALARLETEARLTEAAQQAFGKVTDETKKKITEQAAAAGNAAEALARARVAASTDFQIKTAFLSPQDLQIAQQLVGIYGNDIPRALASSEASGIRTAETLRAISSTLQDVNRGFATDFVQQIRNGATAMDALKTAGSNALGRIADKLAQMAADNLWASAFGGSSGLGGLLGGLFKSGPTMATGLGAGTGGLSFPMFAGGTNSAPGGLSIVGERGPELLNIPRGSQVIPNDILRDMSNLPTNDNASAMHVTVGVSVDNDGNLQAYVKNIAQSATARGIGDYVKTDDFKSRAFTATQLRTAQRWGR